MKGGSGQPECYTSSMEGTFLITGYPRSRTAWLANFLTGINSFCYHEALKWAPPDKIPDLFRDADRKHVGTSDSTLPFYIDQVWKKLPNPKLVVIERPKVEVMTSLQHFTGLDPVELAKLVEKTGMALADLKRNYDPLVIAYNELARSSVCESIWSYCLPGEPFDERRWYMLDGMSVQVRWDLEVREMDPECAKVFQGLLSSYSRV